MAHQRKVIRNAVRNVLLGAETAAGTRVFATQKDSLPQGKLPAICVYMLEESVEGASVSTAPRELTRTVPVIIECWVAGGDGVDDAMDDLAEQVETAMHADPYLGGEVAESILDSTLIVPDPRGDRTMGMIALTYTATYRTYAPAPNEELDDLETVGATYNLGNAVHEDEDAEDLFTVEEA